MRKLGLVTIVAVGLFALVQVGQLASMGVLFAVNGAGLLPALFYLLPALGVFVVAALLIANRRRLSERWFEDSPVELRFDAAAILRVGLILMGAAFVIQSVTGLVGQAVTLLQVYAPHSQFGPEPPLQAVRSLLPQVVQLALGVAVIVWSRSLACRLVPVGKDAGTGSSMLPVCPSCGAEYDPEDYKGGLGTPRCSTCKEPLDIDRA